MLQNEPNRSTTWLRPRWAVASIGVILVISGQYLISNPNVPSTSPTNLGTWLNNRLHLGVSGIDYILWGLPILVAGVILLVLLSRDLRLSSTEELVSDEKPFAIQLIQSAWPWMLTGLGGFTVLLLQLGKLDYGAYSPLLWIFTLMIFAGIAAVWDHRRQVDLSPGLTRQDLLWLIGLLIVGFIICTYRLQGWPDQLMMDEGIFGSTARGVAIGDFKPPVFAQGVDTFPIMSTIFQAWVMKIFGVNMWGWRFGSILPGVMTIVPLFLLARDAFNRRIAVVSSVVLFTSPFFLVYSRLGYTNIQPVFITTLALYLLYFGLRRTSSLFLFLAGCASGLGFYTYFSGRSALVIAILFVLLLWMIRQLKFRNAAFAIALLILGTILVVTPHLVYGFHQDPQSMGFRISLNFFNSVMYGGTFYPNTELTKYAPLFQIGGTDLFFNPMIYLDLIIRGLVQTMLAYQKAWLVWGEHYLACPLAGTVGAIFYIIGLGFSLKNAKQPRVLLIIIWFFAIITIFSALNTFPPREDHMVPITPALALLTGIGLNAIAYTIASAHAWLKERRNMILTILLAIVGIGGLFDYFITGPQKFPPKPADIISWAGLDSHGEAFAYIYEDPAQADFRPLVMTEFLKSVPFETIPADEVINGNKAFSNNQKTVVFYPPELVLKIPAVLQAQWGNSFEQRIFYGADGTPVLVAGMNTPFTFERDRKFLDTLLDWFRQLPFLIFLFLLLSSFTLIAFIPAAWISRLPVWLKRLTDWFNRPGPPRPEEGTEEKNMEWAEAPSDTSPEPTPKHPPDWATELPSFGQCPKPGLLFELKSVRTEEGKDIYIKIHIQPNNLH
jgi:hypothetical protein